MFIGRHPLLVSGASGPLNKPQQVFATSLYTGTSAIQTITNGLDMAGKGAMLMGRRRNVSDDLFVADTARGRSFYLDTATTGPDNATASNNTQDVTAFLSTGFSLGASNYNANFNMSSESQVAWSFCRAPKFFDVVTWTGNGVAGRQIAHNLGIAPGMIGIKRRDAASALGWYVYHTSLSSGSFMLLNATAAAQNGATNVFGNGSVAVAPTSTNFTIGNNADLNASGGTYVAYLFAHDPDTVNGIVQCGSYTAGASASTISLGWQPQFLLIKCSGSIGSWFIIDASRGFNSSAAAALFTDTSQSEASLGASSVYATSTGFVDNFFNSSGQMIFLAIRAAY